MSVDMLFDGLIFVALRSVIPPGGYMSVDAAAVDVIYRLQSSYIVKFLLRCHQK